MAPEQTSHRKRLRLPGFGYAAQGAYFITVCTHKRALLLAEHALADIASGIWQEIPAHFPRVTIDEFVVMPNHIHGILFIGDAEAVGARHASPGSGMPRPKISVSAKDAVIGGRP